MGDYRQVAALGSSFAAGPGLTPVANRAARRSARNYPSLVARALGAGLTDLTVSGATTRTILDSSQRTLGTRFPPQIDAVPADADLITITAGGNDLDYIGAMMRLSVAGRLQRRRLLKPVGQFLAGRVRVDADPAQTAAVTEGLTRVVTQARAKASQARIVLVDYLTVLGDDAVPAPELPLSPAQIDCLRRVADVLAEATRAAADRTGADLVRASALSREHGLGSAEPWVSGFPGGLRSGTVPFHPNPAGMQAVADATVAVLSRR
ncbi:MAG: SGNH/GDSL hydrolase family protein [Actinomycetales bacterium]